MAAAARALSLLSPPTSSGLSSFPDPHLRRGCRLPQKTTNRRHVVTAVLKTPIGRVTLQEYLDDIDDPMEAELRKRYWLPHVTDLDPSLQPYPSNYCTKTRYRSPNEVPYA